MTDDVKKYDWWNIPAFLMWLVFMLAGLASDPVYHVLRDIAGVPTQKALVNNAGVITVAFAVYVGIFTHQRCRDLDVPANEAQGKAIQMGIFALLAFLPFPLVLVTNVLDIPTPELRRVVYVVAPAKLAVWCYVLQLLARYYLFGDEGVFARVTSVFPSSQARKTRSDEPLPTAAQLETTTQSLPEKQQQ